MNLPLFGTTRTVVALRHALIAEDGHVPSTFPGWERVSACVLLSPAMGAGLTQMQLRFGIPADSSDAGPAQARFPADGHEHALYLEEGSLEASWAAGRCRLAAGDFLFTPAHTALQLTGAAPSKLTLFRKRYEAVDGIEAPPVVHGSAAEVPAEPFLGNERARLQVFLPDDPRFDLAMNRFTYQPGATLPFVETHIMEHGLLMLSGQGIYRLQNAYYPVRAGDAIWMAPYCPQWFVAMGDRPASYLYYKNINRLP